jgi:uncharacterized membrane protein YhaH (DUF805 family)
MDFRQAVQSCLTKYVTFSGRAQRSEFWFFVLFMFIASLVASLLDMTFFGVGMENDQPLGSFLSLALLLPSISATVRRLHDVDRSGWWWWLWLIPLVGWIVLLVWFVTKGSSGPNQYGPDPFGGSSGIDDRVLTHRSSIPNVSRDD